MTSQQVSQLNSQVVGLIKSKPSAEGILSACVTAVNIVEQLPGLDGPAKKNLVTSALYSVVNDLPIPMDIKTPLLYVCNMILPLFIDHLISAAQGLTVFLRQEEQKCCKCL